MSGSGGFASTVAKSRALSPMALLRVSFKPLAEDEVLKAVADAPGSTKAPLDLHSSPSTSQICRRLDVTQSFLKDVQKIDIQAPIRKECGIEILLVQRSRLIRGIDLHCFCYCNANLFDSFQEGSAEVS